MQPLPYYALPPPVARYVNGPAVASACLTGIVLHALMHISGERTSYSQPFHERNPQPSDGGCRPCRWERCHIMLDDHSAGGIRRHLLDCHTNDLLPCVAGRCGDPGPMVCRWGLENGHTCDGSYMSATTLSRHISSSHMGAGRVTCDWCQTEFSRKDALKRHQRGNCPWRPKATSASA